jgi:hypothetical protein
MGSRYLVDLADVVRRWGLDVVEVDGWQTRARGSGGYDAGRPTHVMVHHTASGPSSDGWPDVNYIAFGSPDAPLSNLYLNRSGTVWVIAAGATNTNGSGGPLDNVPADAMNAHAVGIEAGNDGVGEVWPSAMCDAYVELVAALRSGYGLDHVRAHWEWAPGRKVDPAGPSRWTGAGSWPMDPFREDVDIALDAGGPDLVGSGMLTVFTVTDAAQPGAVYVSNGGAYRHLPNPDALAALQWFMGLNGLDGAVRTCTRAQIGWAGPYVDDAGDVGHNPYL